MLVFPKGETRVSTRITAGRLSPKGEGRGEGHGKERAALITYSQEGYKTLREGTGSNRRRSLRTQGTSAAAGSDRGRGPEKMTQGKVREKDPPERHIRPLARAGERLRGEGGKSVQEEKKKAPKKDQELKEARRGYARGHRG